MKTLAGSSTQLRAPEDDRGFSLIEALVAMVIFVTAMSVVTSVVGAMTTNMRQAEGVSSATDQTRLAFNRLDKQVRYASAITVPGTGDDATGSYVEFLVDEDDDGSSGDKMVKCLQWRVLNEKLETRTWLVNSGGNDIPGSGHAWVTVATGVVNNLATEPPFVLRPISADNSLRGIAVELRTQRSSKPVGTAHRKAAFYGRNTTATSPENVCDQRGRG